MTNKTVIAVAFSLLAWTPGVTKEAHSPNEAWSMTVPESWTPAPPAALDRMPQGVHSMWQAPEDQDKFRDFLTVTILEEPTYVQLARRDEFRAKVQSAMRPGIEIVEDLKIVSLAKRDVYRVEGHMSPPGGSPLKNVKYFVPSGQQTYVFSFTTPVAKFRESVLAFEFMAGSIQMREGPPSPPGKSGDWTWWITVAGISLFAVCAVAILIAARRQWVAAAES